MSEPAFKFRLAILNEDGSQATAIDTDDITFESALAQFATEVRGYVAEGYDGISMQQERDPADYRG